jgi:PleD family two-component response regulator
MPAILARDATEIGSVSGMKKHARKSWKVVLAEDTAEDALLIEVALKKASRIPVQVHRARNGDTAIVMIEDLLPDLIVRCHNPGRTRIGGPI